MNESASEWMSDKISYREALLLKIFVYFLKGQLHGCIKILKGLKMTYRTKILKKNYHVNQHQKYYKLCFDNFSLQQLDCALDRGQAQF